MAHDLKTLMATIVAVRRCFWRLAALSDEMIGDLGLTASLRAVLEHLATHGNSTVPQIAAEKSVKRQSIQALVDQLRAMNFVETRENPAHRRSLLISLTKSGADVFATIRERERAYLETLMQTLDQNALAVTAETLTDLNAQLSAMTKGDENDDHA